MNSQENQDWERKLKELETQVNPETSSSTVDQSNSAKQLETTLISLQERFNALPSSAKAIVGIVALLLGFSLLGSVLRLITSLISTVILGVVLFLLYQFLKTSRSTE